MENFAKNQINIDADIYRAEFGFGVPNAKLPIYLIWNEVKELMQKFNFQIPSEVQWEYAARAGKNNLFYFGNQLPYDEEVLEKGLCLVDFQLEDIDDQYANSFGLCGLGVGEWCLDSWSESHKNITSHLPHKDSKNPYRVIKGGAALTWPWQDPFECLNGITAIRMSSQELEDNTSGIRAVIPLVV